MLSIFEELDNKKSGTSLSSDVILSLLGEKGPSYTGSINYLVKYLILVARPSVILKLTSFCHIMFFYFKTCE